MPSGSSSKHHSSSSSKSHGSSSKHQQKSDDWSDVTEPDERRRIQNRIAQRKFRKYSLQKERQERETRNQELAGSSYQVPMPDDFMSMGAGAGYDDQLSGVPWGGLNLQHMVTMGHESQSRRGSRRETPDHYDYAGADPQFYDAQLMSSPYGGGGMAYSGDDRYFGASASSPSYSFFDTGHDNFSGASSSSTSSRTTRY
ncbi:hypothetical protein VP1G_04082 [Cytospora mali]|uniref:BZIP domain-containing protein n=1 Tax=Cytospora mali TaxID=578113 RepID=A0A194UYP1_CYTMA|nr:hypothetical protein VP1G_04082 [Valsa mali var. pyri (nom. inval.)]